MDQAAQFSLDHTCSQQTHTEEQIKYMDFWTKRAVQVNPQRNPVEEPLKDNYLIICPRIQADTCNKLFILSFLLCIQSEAMARLGH
jgi:hypothetical protein